MAMSSIQPGERIKADFFTTTHRITGDVETRLKPLSDLLNDKTQSYLMLFNAYVSRLTEPGGIVAHSAVAYLSKENLNFVIVAAREIRLPDSGRFSAHEYATLATLPRFEIQGRFTGPHRIDLRSFSPATFDAFVALMDASARLIDVSEATFAGEGILVNRARLESLCLSE
jgi:hypothetical protein